MTAAGLFFPPSDLHLCSCIGEGGGCSCLAASASACSPALIIAPCIAIAPEPGSQSASDTGCFSGCFLGQSRAVNSVMSLSLQGVLKHCCIHSCNLGASQHYFSLGRKKKKKQKTKNVYLALVALHCFYLAAGYSPAMRLLPGKAAFICFAAVTLRISGKRG